MPTKSTKGPATKRVKKSTTDQIKYVYIMRCCRPDMTSTNGFVWPESGPVECPDWNPRAVCGSGLHGWLWGEGNLTASGDVWRMPDAKWLVVRVAEPDVVDLDGKVKFRAGDVVFCGTAQAAAVRICELGASGGVHFGTATAGDAGTATAGYAGTATAGDAGTATAGTRGTATAGYDGIVAITWYDSAQGRYQLARGLVGENGIEPNVPYVVEDGKLVRKDGKR